MSEIKNIRQSLSEVSSGGAIITPRLSSVHLELSAGCALIRKQLHNTIVVLQSYSGLSQTTSPQTLNHLMSDIYCWSRGREGCPVTWVYNILTRNSYFDKVPGAINKYDPFPRKNPKIGEI